MLKKELQKMKIMSISDIAISAIENEDKIKLMILREKWKELFSELAEISTVIDFNEKIIYIKSYDSVLKHYIFANKQKLINEIMESLEIKFEIEDIKIKKQTLLREYGFPDDYMEMQYECEDCKDTGMTATGRCHCFNKKLIDI